ncbi:hypothetical protein HJG60_008473 [Phyllostomus discolor]|uniref:Translation initiation factor IF-2-like n=1 Tax=Phyllostomus discolor TaxID=89673 RepID=A0A833Z8I3_9CHIR|nr:hypothetical protein HJG60_008473 [Phyllostomus discolor]
MTRCCRRYLFVVSVPLRAFAPLFSGCWAVGRWERREAKGRAERTDSDSSRAPAAVSTSQRTAGTWAPGRPRVTPSATRTLPQAPAFPEALEAARAKPAGDRQTERPPPFPSAPTPLARTQRKERRRGSSGAGSAAASLTAPALGLEGMTACCRREDTGPRSGVPTCWGGRRGARGERAAPLHGFEGDWQ